MFNIYCSRRVGISGHFLELFPSTILNLQEEDAMDGKNLSAKLTKNATQEFLVFLAENTPCPIYLIQKDGSFMFANKAAIEHLGYDSDEILKIGPPEMDPWYDILEWPHHWEEMKVEGHRVFETRHRRKDGTLVPVEIHASFVHFDNTPFICAFAVDISNRIETGDLLNELKERFDRIVKASDDNFFILDDAGIVTVASPAACRRLGYDESEIKGRSLTDFLSEDSVKYFHEMFPVVLKEDDVTCELVFLHKDNHEIPSRCYPSVITDEHDEITSVILFERK